MNGQMDYSSVSFAQARLQPTIKDGINAGAQSLQQAIAGPNPVLDHFLAYYLAAFNVASYHDTPVKDYVVNYQDVLHYELEAADIAFAGSWLYYHDKLSKNDFLSLLSRLYSDPDVSTGAKLSIEDMQYQLGVL